jgi:hypothetical protein
MDENIPCSKSGCKGSKIYSIAGFDIFWIVCPIYSGLESIKKRVPDYEIEYQN